MSHVKELQQWYALHCEGGWEHGSGIRIETIDNPGWLIRIDLAGTELQSEDFDPIVTTTNDAGWADIRIRDGVWQAACDPVGLDAAIGTFLEWARGFRRPR
ncbi:MAG: immunity 53 family protein [Deltaproteobacteria bacterium]|nr:immunity 53 family protein [Deltaproteobacteria bacterium]